MATSESVAKLQSAVSDVTAHVENMIDHLKAQLDVVERLSAGLSDQLAAEEAQAAVEAEVVALAAPVAAEETIPVEPVVEATPVGDAAAAATPSA